VDAARIPHTLPLSHLTPSVLPPRRVGSLARSGALRAFNVIGMETNIPITDQSDEQIMEIVRQLQVAYKLKRTLRYGTQRNFEVHSESVAEHVFSLFFLSQYFLPLEDPRHALDVEKLYRIFLFHDFGEITHGDVPYHIKTKKHEEREREAAKVLFKSLPSSLQEVSYENWQDYEEQRSPEAHFASALDKIEPMFELFDPINELSMKRLKFSYQAHIGKKIQYTEEFPIMRKFVEVMTRDMLERGVFWVDE